MQILTFDILNQELKHTHTHSLYLAITVGIQIGYHLTLRECQIPIKMYTRIYVDSTIQYVCCLNVSVDFTWFLLKYLHAILSFVKFNNHYCFFGHFVCWFFPSILIYLNPIPCGRNTQSFSCTERVTHFNTLCTILPEYSLYTLTWNVVNFVCTRNWVLFWATRDVGIFGIKKYRIHSYAYISYQFIWNNRKWSLVFIVYMIDHLLNIFKYYRY